MSMKPLLTRICALLAIIAFPASSFAYSIVQTSVSHPTPTLERTDYTIQVAADPNERFHIYRLRHTTRTPKAVVMLLPPLGSGFQNYEITADNDYNKSFAAFFAKKRSEVWGLSQRTQDLVLGDCESGAVDCSFLGDYGIQAFVDDTQFARGMVASAVPNKPVVVGGLSLGSIVAIAAINQNPNDYEGALLLEGTPFDTNPEVQQNGAMFCGIYDGLLSAGIVADAQQNAGIKTLTQLAIFDPDSPSPIPGFPPGLTNHQVWVLALSEGQVTPLSPRADYFLLAGDFMTDSFDYVDEAYVSNSLFGFTDYLSNRMIRDINCSWAGDQTFVNNLDAYTGKVFISAGGHGFGTGMLDTADLMSNAEVLPTIFIPEFGHVDAFYAQFHLFVEEFPIFIWLKTKIF